jgi:hypothetical protein
MSMPTIDADCGYYVRTRCPACGIVEDVAIALVAVLQRTTDESQLRVKVGQNAAKHRCGQLRILDVDRATGEIAQELGA